MDNDPFAGFCGYGNIIETIGSEEMKVPRPIDRYIPNIGGIMVAMGDVSS